MTKINGRCSENSTSDHDKESEPKQNATFETRGKGTNKNDILLTISNFNLKTLRFFCFCFVFLNFFIANKG